MTNWLIDKLDILTTKLQRRGWLLTNMQVYAVGLIFVSSIGESFMGGYYGWMAINGGLWGLALWERTAWATRNQDYPSSVRMTLRLNAEALDWRDSNRLMNLSVVVLGISFTCTNIMILVVAPEPRFFLLLAEWITIPSAWLLRCCTFVGPGEFAKQKQDVIEGQTVDSRP